LNHQLLFGVLPGLALGLVAFFTPLSLFKKWSLAALLLNIILLGMVFLPLVGANIGGAHRWIFLGPISFQPSELLKITFILYVASWLAGRTPLARRSAPRAPKNHLAKSARDETFKKTFLPFVSMLGIVSLLLVLQPDVSTLFVVSSIALVLYFLAGTPVWHSFAIVGAGFAILLLLIRIAPYRLNRLLVFLDPSQDPLGKSYQLKQALIGIGSGGLTGAGFGLSFQKFGVLPEPISDSIFAVFAEETGFVGSAFLILLLFAFTWRGFVISQRASDQFSRLTAAGIAFWIFFQSAVNIGSMIGVFPLAGIPLPFISYGGSALVVELIALGILLNISRQKS